MDRERWQRIEALYHAALELVEPERGVFLAQACGADEDLRREVESLLAAHGQAGSFIAGNAVEDNAGRIAAAPFTEQPTAQFPAQIGRTINQYRIISAIGKGGMGEIWLAEDTRLHRKVALKLLPSEFIADADRVRRFEQEARTVSALNHPNIITLFDLGHAGDDYFMATEFVDGQTLRERLRNDARLPLPEAIEIALQICHALAAAHDAGIIHRDIKPENIMLRRDGYVKVLDFGLAKVSEGPSLDGGASQSSLTDPGTVMGTASYMSPEQARGQKVDARTDTFSLGIVLYEMIAGRTPFEGANAFEMIAAILDREPAPLTESSEELQRILSKALRKDREQRYLTIRELQSDLTSFKRRIELAEDREQTSGEAKGEATWPFAAETDQAAAQRTNSSAKIIFSEIKRHKLGVAATLAALITIAGGAGFWLYKLIGQKSSTPSYGLKFTRLTSTGKATRAAISPDGKYVVYAQDEGGQQSLWVTQVAASSNVQIVPPTEVNYQGITFAHDGNFIYYVRVDKENPSGALWHSPVLGGNARKLFVNISSPITLSPDGKQLAFVRGDALTIANPDGSEEKKLAAPRYPDGFSAGGPAWSPDGKIIACGQRHYTGGLYRNVVGVRVADGTEQPITSRRWAPDATTPTRVAWLSENSGVLATLAEPGGSLTQIWYLAWLGDETRSVTNDLNGYADLTLTADFGALAAVRSDRVVNLWIAPNGDTSRVRQITSGTAREDGVRGLSWTPDGKIVYRSNAGGNPDVWITAADVTGNKQLSANPTVNGAAAVSPDGRYIVWNSRQEGRGNIWRMEIDGSNPKKLTNGSGELFPQVSFDGQWVVYGVQDSPLWKTSVDGGEPVQLTEKSAMRPVFSPDGRFIACNYRDEASGPYRVAVIPFAGGPPTRIFDIWGGHDQPLQWTPDGRAIAFIRTTNGVSNLWAQPLNGGQQKQLTDFKDQRIFNFAWSRDGKQLALSRGVINSDVVLMTGFRQQ